MKNTLFFLLLLATNFLNAQPINSPKRPNILLCIADDWGWPHAGAYGDREIKTPNFDRLAREGVLFNYAFVSSPSCTPSRNAVITGKYHWELGPGANLWSTLPAEHQSFVHLLAQQGYITGRTAAKTWGPGKIDSWVATHGFHPAGRQWESLPAFLNDVNSAKAPFFFWLGTSDPHRPYKKGSGEKRGIDLEKVQMFSHFPDSKVVRSDVADYYFEVQRWDRKIGRAIAELEKRGLLENTIIIMTGDHGMPFPRCKGNLYDSGSHVPLVVRWGEKVNPNLKINEFVSLTDIAPTLLECAKTAVPENMTGHSFLNLLVNNPREKDDIEYREAIVYGRERHTTAQERPNLGGYPSRAFRSKDFLYIRNYEPDLWPAGTGDTSRTNQAGQWYADCDAGPTKNYIINNKDTDTVCAHAFTLCFAKRPAEELYDLKKDPGQIHNVAQKVAYKQVLREMRKNLHERLITLNDPRAKNPHYKGFDKHPYYGGGGGRIAR